MVISGGALRGVNINRLKGKFGKYLSQNPELDAISCFKGLFFSRCFTLCVVTYLCGAATNAKMFSAAERKRKS